MNSTPTPNPDPERLIAIGDIHGCLEQLIGLLHRIDPTPRDQLVFLGDYVDRGPNSSGVLAYLLELCRELPATVFLMGNHERMFLDFLDDIDSLSFLVNGGTMTLTSYRQDDKVRVPQEHIDFLRGLRLLFETPEHVFVHAGLRPEIPLDRQREEDLLWIRGEFLNHAEEFGKIVVHGHTPVDKPALEPHRIGLDTGAVYGRYLTACDVLNLTLWHFPDP